MKEYFFINGVDVVFVLSFALGVFTGLIIPLLGNRNKDKQEGGEK